MSATSNPLAAATSAPPRVQRTVNANINNFSAGLTRIDPRPYAIVCMHIGPSVEVTCDRGG